MSFFTGGGLAAGDDAESGDVYAYDAAGDELIRVSAPPGGAGSYTCLNDGAVQCYGDGGFDTDFR